MREEILFWIIAAGMLVLAVAAVFCGLRWSHRINVSHTSRMAANREALAQQLEQLKRDAALGLISDTLYREGVADIERRALTEIDSDRQADSEVHFCWPVFGSVALLTVAATVFLYLVLGAPQLIGLVSGVEHGGIMQADGSLAQKKNAVTVQQLEQYLAVNADDERALVLYARLLAEKEQWVEAEVAYKKAIALNHKVVNDPQVLIEHAATALSTRDDAAMTRAIDSLERALRIDGRNMRAHEMMAIVALQTERWGLAREHLEVLLEVVPPDSDLYERLAQTAAEAAHRERQMQGKD